MPDPWLTTALKAIPWSMLWAQAPAIIDASRKLFVRARDLKSAPPASERTRDTDGLETRLAALEQNERLQAALLEQIASQTEQLTLGLAVLAARVRLVLAVAAAALGVAILLVVWMLLR